MDGWALRVVTEPVGEPVTLTEAKDHLRVDGTSEDTYIGALITAARQHVEHATRRALITQTLELTLDRLPLVVELPRAPIQAVNSISYVDSDGVTQTLDASLYRVDTKSAPGRITRAYGASWPTPRAVTGAVTINYDAGYGLAADVPQAIKHAMLLIIGHLYENREAVIVGTTANDMPLAVDALLAPYRLYGFG